MRSIIKLLFFFLQIIIFSSTPVSQAQENIGNQIAALSWVKAPNTVNITDRAKFKLSGNLQYLNESETDKFLQLNGNLPEKNSLTIMDSKESWFAIFDFTADGYVKDDEAIDADALLKNLKEGNEQGLEERKKQGIAPLYIDGWYIPPRYDNETKRLEWAISLHDEENNKVINFTTRILGRSGFIGATLVSNPTSLEKDIKSFKRALKNFDYVSGEKYAEWKDGDKVAAYGLGALVLGGTAAAVASKGGFKFLWALILAAIAGIGGLFKRFFGKSNK